MSRIPSGRDSTRAIIPAWPKIKKSLTSAQPDLWFFDFYAGFPNLFTKANEALDVLEALINDTGSDGLFMTGETRDVVIHSFASGALIGRLVAKQSHPEERDPPLEVAAMLVPPDDIVRDPKVATQWVLEAMRVFDDAERQTIAEAERLHFDQGF